MSRAFTLLTLLAHHPDIQPWIAPGMGQIDLSEWNVPGAYIFGDFDGAVLFRELPHLPGAYEMHYLFTEMRRGKEALDWIRYCVTSMFTEHDATVICGAVPREHRASRVMSRALGAQPIGSHTDSFGRACVVYTIEREPWVRSLAESSGASVH